MNEYGDIKEFSSEAEARAQKYDTSIEQAEYEILKKIRKENRHKALGKIRGPWGINYFKNAKKDKESIHE